MPLAACRSVFTSDSLVYPVEKDAKAVGLSYALPKAVIRGKLVVDRQYGAFVMCLLAKPVAVADPHQQYYMPFNNSPFSADTYTITKDDTTGRLVRIEVKTIDRFDEFAVNLGKSAGALSRAFRQEGAQLNSDICLGGNASLVVLATFDIDPADDVRTKGDMAAINEVMLRFAKREKEKCASWSHPVKGEAPNDDVITKEDACREYRRITKTYSSANPPIRMRWELPSVGPVVKPDCSVGFCYRHTLPHTVQLAMAGSSVHSYTYQLPNASPIVAMDITRAITVTKTTNIDFGELGQITKIHVQKGDANGAKGSEAEGLALIPYNVVQAYFGAMSDTAKIIGTAFTSEKDMLANKAARDEAEIDGIKKRRALQAEIAQEGGAAGEEYAIMASNGLNVNVASAADAAVAAKTKADAAKAAAVKTAADAAAKASASEAAKIAAKSAADPAAAAAKKAEDDKIAAEVAAVDKAKAEVAAAEAAKAAAKPPTKTGPKGSGGMPKL